MTLIHTLVKSFRGVKTLNEEQKTGIIDLMQRCHNMSLRDNQNKTVYQLLDEFYGTEENYQALQQFRTICQRGVYVQVAAHEYPVRHRETGRFLREALRLQMFQRWKRACWVFSKLHERGRSMLPNRYVVREVVKYID